MKMLTAKLLNACVSFGSAWIMNKMGLPIETSVSIGTVLGTTTDYIGSEIQNEKKINSKKR